MSTPSQCFNVVRGKVLRATILDDCCGVYVDSPPAYEVVVTEGLISVALTAEIEAGETIRDRNWAGNLCVVDRSPDQFLYWNVEVTMCGVDPALISLLTGAPIEVDGDGDLVGFRTVEGGSTQNVALELWSGTTPTDCAGSGASYGYTLLPCLSGGRMGDFTIQNGRADLIVAGAYTKSGEGWEAGPYDVIDEGGGVGGPLEAPIQQGEHHLLRRTTIAPPTAACEAYTLEEAGGTRPTS